MEKRRCAIWLMVFLCFANLGRTWIPAVSAGNLPGIAPEPDQAYGQIRGQVMLQGRSYHDSVSIWLDDSRFTGTGADGLFSFSQVPPGQRRLRASRDGFLCSQVTVTVMAGEVLHLDATLLRAGDANRDGQVNLMDLVIVGTFFRTQPPVDPRADVNGDGVVDLLDLILVGGNMGLACPMLWVVLIETPTPTPKPATATPTVTRTPVFTATPTITRTPLGTATDTPQPTRSSTVTPAHTSSATPSSTTTATQSPMPTATSTSTPRPTATPTTIPTPIPGDNVQCREQGSAQICAWVADGNPSQTSAQTVYGRLQINGVAQAGQVMDTIWHFQSRTSACTGVTGSDGVAGCRRIFVNEPAGFQVNVGVTIGGYTVTTWFTPR
ncbi:MAG: carboxypeptidase regulatory-like domain-containing protein [Chloroflexi bacterium]|nr:carboxypeptidase regulatory-like domain-containing protein [Chloroflexota bacterium]